MSLAPLLREPQLGGGLDDDLHHLVGRLGDEAARVVLGPDSIGKCFAMIIIQILAHTISTNMFKYGKLTARA